MTNILVVVALWPQMLAGSSAWTALERFCGEPLLDRALVRARAFDDIPVVVASRLVGAVDASVHVTSTRGLEAALRDVGRQRSTAAIVGLAIDPLYPMLTLATLRALVDSAKAGRAAAAGLSPSEVAALAVPFTISEAPVEAPALIGGNRDELARVASKRDLVELERRAYADRANELLDAGLLLRDPLTTRIDGAIRFGVDVEIGPGCTLRGPITLGDRVRIGAACLLTRATIGDDTEVKPFTIIEDASIGERSFVGPYARVRPGTSAGPEAQIGNFVELKAARLGRGSRINHLSFVGDATLGDRVTIGAGTITCNHDGVRTQSTTMGNGVYVGSGCVLVAPVAIGDGATIGAGSTITKDAPSSKLTLARARQLTVEGWAGFEAKRK